MTQEYLFPDQIQAIENAAMNFRDKLLIHLLYYLGCRISELLGIATENIDFDSGKVTIVHLKSRVYLNCRNCGNKLGLKHEYCPKCGVKSDLTSLERSERRRQRQLPLDPASVDMIKKHIEQGGPVFRDGKTNLFNINRHRAWQIVRECAKKAGLGDLINPETGKVRGVSPHRLRDAFAVHAMKVDDSGEGMRLLQVHLGHTSFNTTARYRKIASEEHKAWFEKLWKNEHDNKNSV
jgi:integrase/recombinase XerD